MTEEKPEKSATEKKLIEQLLAAAIQVDFPDNPPLDKDGNPKFTKIDEQLRFLPFNDLGNTQRLLKRYGDELLYVENIGWYGWNGKCWSDDEGRRIAEKRAHETATGMKREALVIIHSGQYEDETPKDFRERWEKYRKFANASGNSSRISAMLEMAETYLSVQHDMLDTHKFLVTVDNGTLCLDAGKDEDGKQVIHLKKHDPKDRISKKMAVKYDEKSECPKFRNFLEEIQPDKDVQNMLQRYAGYCLTGAVSEQVIMMMTGGGSNGKSTLMGILNWLLGDYAQNIPIASLMAQKQKSGSNATPDLARLPGARFVTASEPDAGERFSESLLKLVSGGEKMAVRNLNEGFFEFLPQFKLCISFNNKPVVYGSDDGFWRRVLLVPFEQKFVNADKLNENPGAKVKNKNLEEELKSEGSGILNWMIDGYLMWREAGLMVPEKIWAATAEYRADSNQLLQFIQDWCVYDVDNQISSTRLYEAYSLWAKDNTKDLYSKTMLGIKINGIPQIKRTRSGLTNFYKGLRFKPEAELSMQGSHGTSGDGGDVSM